MFRIVIFILCLVSNNLFAQDNSKIIASIRPLQSIIANITDEEVDLIIDRNESLHNYQLKPTKISVISDSKLTIIIDRNFEVFLNKVLDKQGNKLIEVAKLPGMTLFKNQEDDHDDDHDHDHHHDSVYNYHLWLDTANVKNIATALADRLSADNPENKEKYSKNLENFSLKLNQLDQEISIKLANARGKNYLVTHDAYKYFSKRYHLNEAISMTIDHDHNIGARTLLDIQKMIKDNKVTCVFEEAQFSSEITSKLKQDSKINIGKLDAEWGPENVPVKDAYFAMMNALADSFSQCLK